MPLLIIQKRLTRVISNADYLAHSEPLFKTNNILKIQDLHDYVLAQYMYKHHVNQGDAFNSIHTYQTSGSNNARPKFQRLTQTQLSVLYAGPNVWNALPQHIRGVGTMNCLKKKRLRNTTLTSMNKKQSTR